MSTWHTRLQEALTARGKDWPYLVEITGKTKQSVYKWKPNVEGRTNQMDWDNAIKVCNSLKIEHDWLCNGTKPSGLEENDCSDGPVALSTSALKIAETYDDLPSEAQYKLSFMLDKMAMESDKPFEEILLETVKYFIKK